MPRISLAQIQQLPDILSTEHFTFFLGSLPGGGDANGNLMLKCMEAVISGFGNTAFPVQLAGYVRNFRGMKTYGQDHSLNISYVEDTQMQTYYDLRNWNEQIVGTASGTSIGGVADYAVQEAYLTIYDQAGNQVDVLTFYNVILQDVQDVQISGSDQSTPMRLQVGFKFDYYTSSLAAPR